MLVRNANAKRASLAALLFLVGTAGGAVGGGAIGLYLGRHSKPKIGIPPPTPPAPAVAAAKPAPTLAQNPPPAAVPPDGGVKPATKPTTELCVEVRDAGGRLVAGALINVRALPTGGATANSEHKDIGELGVYSTSLPFPDDVISGQYTPLGRAPLSIVRSDGTDGLRTDEHGRACAPLVGPGSFGVTAVKEERSASVELTLPPVIESAGKALPLSIILRLGEPLEALCRLTTPSPLPSAEDAGEPVSAALGPDVTGRVVDGRGFGLSAVRLDALIGAGRAHLSGISDGTGSFRLLGLPRGALTLRAELSGYAPTTVNRRADESRSDLQLVLRPGGGIAGMLRDARAGNLPAGAQLLLSAADGSTIKVPLNSDGSFSLSGLPIGAATLRARAPGHAALNRALQITATESPGQFGQRDLRLELEAGASLAGQVRGPTNDAGATITATAEDGTLLGKTLSDERGEFRFTDLPAGRVRISASSSQGRGETAIDLRTGGAERVYLELKP